MPLPRAPAVYRLQAPSYSLLEEWLGTILISIGGYVFGSSLSSPMSHAVDEDTLQSTMLFAMLLGATLRWCYPIGAGRAVSLARLLVAMPVALASETVQIATGEAACEASAKSRDECLAIGCCQWVHNTCWSAVGSAPCLPSKDPLPPVCEERCTYSSDGECDDGGINSQYDNCGCGRDCFDCGPRENPMQQCPENWYDSDDGFSYAPFSDEWWSGGEGWATPIVFCFFFFFWNSVVWGVFVTQVLLDAMGGMRCFLTCFLAPFVWCGLALPFQAGFLPMVVGYAPIVIAFWKRSKTRSGELEWEEDARQVAVQRHSMGQGAPLGMPGAGGGPRTMGQAIAHLPVAVARVLSRGRIETDAYSQGFAVAMGTPVTPQEAANPGNTVNAVVVEATAVSPVGSEPGSWRPPGVRDPGFHLDSTYPTANVNRVY